MLHAPEQPLDFVDPLTYYAPALADTLWRAVLSSGHQATIVYNKNRAAVEAEEEAKRSRFYALRGASERIYVGAPPFLSLVGTLNPKYERAFLKNSAADREKQRMEQFLESPFFKEDRTQPSIWVSLYDPQNRDEEDSYENIIAIIKNSSIILVRNDSFVRQSLLSRIVLPSLSLDKKEKFRSLLIPSIWQFFLNRAGSSWKLYTGLAGEGFLQRSRLYVAQQQTIPATHALTQVTYLCDTGSMERPPVAEGGEKLSLFMIPLSKPVFGAWIMTKTAATRTLEIFAANPAQRAGRAHLPAEVDEYLERLEAQRKARFIGDPITHDVSYEDVQAALSDTNYRFRADPYSNRDSWTLYDPPTGEIVGWVKLTDDEIIWEERWRSDPDSFRVPRDWQGLGTLFRRIQDLPTSSVQQHIGSSLERDTVLLNPPQLKETLSRNSATLRIAQDMAASAPITSHNMADAGDVRVAIRKLFQDHTGWTREYLLAALLGTKNLTAAAKRLYKNQADIGGFVGAVLDNESAGEAVHALFKEHIDIAAQIVTLVIQEDDISAASASWNANGAKIADALSATLAPYLPENRLVRQMMQKHLDTTTAELNSIAAGDYEKSVEQYHVVLDHMLHMADLVGFALYNKSLGAQCKKCAARDPLHLRPGVDPTELDMYCEKCAGPHPHQHRHGQQAAVSY